MLLITLTMIILSILFLLLIILNLMSKKSFSDREKASPYECGFDPLTPPRLPFSLHFFLIAIIFLIFDIELALLLPIILALKISNILNLALFTIIFIYILLIGLYHEWHQGALSWVS